MTRYTLLFLIFLQFSVVQSQEYYFRHYKVENGLSHNTILCSLQDSKGFLWFGTKDGLNRFDGYTFKYYKQDIANPKSLGSNFVECILEFNDMLWLGTDNGLYKYNRIDESFELIESSNGLSILDIESDNHGNIWFVAGITVFKYNIKSKKSKSYSNNLVTAQEITKTPEGNIWVAIHNYIYEYKRETDSFVQKEISLKTDNNQYALISKIYAISEHEIALGTQNNGTIIYNTQKNELKKLAIKTEKQLYVRDFLKKENDLLIATESGLWIYNLKDGSVKNLKKNYNDPFSLSDNAVYCLTLDKEEGIWAGTYFGGINYFPKQYTPFKKYIPKLGENSISGNAVREIESDQLGNLWIGTEDAGLNKLNIKTGEFTNYLPDKSIHSISHDNIHGLLIKDHKIWVGTFEHGLDIMDIKTGLVNEHYSTSTKGNLRSNFIYAFYKDKNEDIYAITTSGIQLFNNEQKEFIKFKGFPEGYFYTSLLEDSKGRFWAGTYWEGLYFFDPKSKRAKVFRYDKENLKTISSNAINGIFEDSNNNVWITTENGLNKYNAQKQLFKHYTTKEGLPSNVTYSILEDHRHYLWITTSKGLVEFNPKTEEINTYTKANGLLSDQFNYHSAYKAEDGTMYFGSVDGMISFNPMEFGKNEFKPQIFITKISINNKEVSIGNKKSDIPKSVTSLEEITLNPKDLSITIDFAALSFNAPKMTEYWYKLEGLNEGWVFLDKNHSVSFTGLPSGDYNFHIKSRNSNGVWSYESTNLKINVLPPWWKSNLAYAVYFIVFLLVVYLLLWFYHSRTKAKNDRLIVELNRQKEKELYNSKIEFFTNISHEIRTPLTLIKSPLEKILKNTDHDEDLLNNLSIMGKNTDRLLNLVNQLLDFRKAELKGTNLNFIKVNISELIRDIYTRFTPVVSSRNIDFVLDLGPTNIYAYVDLEALKKILSNLFNNAIKYAEGKILLSLSSDEEFLELKIKNDGKIIPDHLKHEIFQPYFMVPEVDYENKSSTGIGLSLAHSLVELHKGSLKLELSDPNFNTFALNLPIHQENEFNLFETTQVREEELNEDNIIEIEEDEKSKILLVEDNQDLLDFLANDLTNKYHVIKSINANKALEKLSTENIQLIISDVMMPGMNGFELCKEVKTNIETSHIPIILLTAKNTLTAKIEGLESGADAYIEKPFSIEHLKAQINNLLLNRKTLIEHYSSSPLAHVKSIAHTKTDEVFIKKLDEAIYANISDGTLNVERLAELMNMSKSTLYRKIKNLSNLSPNELINITRLKKAAEYLRTGDYKIYEIAYMVGYNSQISLLRNFQKQFNMTPSDYINAEN
ncbi:hybrid sensor histidine kinase/response regulator transcription factor [Flavivirga sp. 57AJ16]|uniref:hybrid sensor histidine kinase/response regulator transcription factor n=1 Tax=Flavivirga sp. 57AJ16 TaxID=3025307 RepID=UPI0023653B30|nr:hybrid sensor histidine kinase/response regulator transcription factor [Flavivirga sp. 57AJ16]MDD7885115.1 two-component regulator propeller domain-containing protein [Flavivirga sp. 57AJ16]